MSQTTSAVESTRFGARSLQSLGLQASHYSMFVVGAILIISGCLHVLVWVFDGGSLDGVGRRALVGWPVIGCTVRRCHVERR